jgi:ubiquinone/menaquinone biosynthesis C-methylase UbiE
MQTRDEDATKYDRAFFTDFQTRVEMQAYTGAFAGRPSRRALDVGCATGRTLETMVSAFPVGIDLSREELQIAQERFGQKGAFLQASATHLPFRDGVFDRLLCTGVMLHIPNDETRRLAVQEMARVVSRPSRLLVATHGYPWVVKRMFPKQTVNHNLSWYRFDAAELEQLLRKELAPCRVSVRGICHLPRWRIGNKLGSFGVWLDGVLSRIPGLTTLTGTILVAEVDCTAAPERQ